MDAPIHPRERQVQRPHRLTRVLRTSVYVLHAGWRLVPGLFEPQQAMLRGVKSRTGRPPGAVVCNRIFIFRAVSTTNSSQLAWLRSNWLTEQPAWASHSLTGELRVYSTASRACPLSCDEFLSEFLCMHIDRDSDPFGKSPSRRGST